MNDAATTIRDMERLADHYKQSGHANSAELIRDAIDLINQPVLRWTSERPTEPGIYLFRRIDDDVFWAGSFGDDDAIVPPRWFAEREFAGPITVAEPTPESGAKS
jgi:hypothetical protein